MWGWFIFLLVLITAIYLIPRITFSLKWSVYTQSMASYKTLTQTGKSHEEALNYIVNWLRYREPFNQLTDVDAKRIFETVKRTSNPIHVTALILQNCEWSNENIENLRKQETLTQWVITEDVKYSIQMLLRSARTYSRYQNSELINSLVNAIKARSGWSYDGNDFYFNKEKHNPINNDSTFEYVKMVITAEMKYQLSQFQSDTNDLTDYLVRKSILNNINDFTREALNEIASEKNN